MTQIKFCGLTRAIDIKAANALLPEYIGFVFVPQSKRFILPQNAEALKKHLSPAIQAVGVFADEAPERIAALLADGVISIVQLHGSEDETYIRRLKKETHAPVIKAFCIRSEKDARAAEQSTADFILLDAGAGCGNAFDWKLIEGVRRPYFLAGGLSPGNVGKAVKALHPFGVDVSSGIEMNGLKDEEKMAAFAAAVRKEEGK